MRALDRCFEAARTGRGRGDLAPPGTARAAAPAPRPCRRGRSPAAWSLAIGLVAIVAAAAAAAEPDQPYEAHVAADHAYVRSGPGPSFYPTDKLARGAQVEIYRRDPGNWYAIRPPRGSFTWVAAHYVERGSDGLGTIAEQNVPARVGSRFSTIREVIQVRLQRGETVEIVGQQAFRGETWYKIEPPSGEFRWIAGSDLDVAPAAAEPTTPAADSPAADRQESVQTSVARQAQPVAETPGRDEFRARGAGAETPPARTASARAAGTRRASSARLVPVRHPQDPSRSPAAAGWRGTSPPTRSDQTNRAVRPAAEAAAVAELSASAEPSAPANAVTDSGSRTGEHSDRSQYSPKSRAERLRQDPVSSSQKSRSRRYAPAQQDRPSRPETAADQNRDSAAEIPSFQLADRLEQELSIMVAEEPTVWEFGEIRRSAKLLVDAAATAVDRSRGREILRKIKRLEDIRRRHQRAAAVVLDNPSRPRPEPAPNASPASRQNRPLARDPTPPAPRPAAQAAAGFDGTGTLRPVVSRRRGAPRYALVDASGAVVSFVTPAPGVNLQPYIGRKIGVRGTRGYMPQYRRTHVTAQNVTDLAQHWVR